MIAKSQKSVGVITPIQTLYIAEIIGFRRDLGQNSAHIKVHKFFERHKNCYSARKECKLAQKLVSQTKNHDPR